MKKLSALVIAAALAVSGAALAQDPPPAGNPAPAQGQRPKPEALQDRASYIIGLNLGQSLKAQEVAVNPDLIVQGLRDGLAGADPVLTAEEIQAAMQEFQQKLMAEQQEKRAAQAEKNQKESQAFLEEMKKKPGVRATESGLLYEVVQEGSGESPKPTDQVTVHYRGTLPDGTVFDSSYDRGQPASFPVNGVIPGWVEALQLMKPGGKLKLYIPPALAYGERGAGGDIGPNQALVFDVELISIGQDEPAAAEGEQPAAGEQPPAEGEKPPAE